MIKAAWDGLRSEHPCMDRPAMQLASSLSIWNKAGRGQRSDSSCCVLPIHGRLPNVSHVNAQCFPKAGDVHGETASESISMVALPNWKPFMQLYSLPLCGTSSGVVVAVSSIQAGHGPSGMVGRIPHAPGSGPAHAQQGSDLHGLVLPTQ